MSNLKVKVVDTEIDNRQGISAKTGKPYSIRNQVNVLVELNYEVRRLAVRLEDNESAYLPGQYMIDPITLLTIGKFGDLEIDRYKPIKLIPVALAAGVPK